MNTTDNLTHYTLTFNRNNDMTPTDEQNVRWIRPVAGDQLGKASDYACIIIFDENTNSGI